MINLAVDEGYAYDFLAILKVKENRNLISNVMFEKYSAMISYQVGKELHDEIISSNEFDRCVQINDAVFITVDLAKGDAVKASSVDQLNTVRFKNKIELQKKFFPQNEVTEVKS